MNNPLSTNTPKDQPPETIIQPPEVSSTPQAANRTDGNEPFGPPPLPPNPAKLSSKSLLIIGVSLLIAVAIPVSVYVAQQSQDIRQQAAQIPAPKPFPPGTNGEYTNICGSSYAATYYDNVACPADCDPRDGHCRQGGPVPCQGGGPCVIKWTCNGRLSQCKDNEVWGTEFFVHQPALCDKTVQLDVYPKHCRLPDGGWDPDPLCNDTKGYMVWYSGTTSCPVNPTPTPTPAPGCTGITTSEASTNGTTWTSNNISVPRGTTVYSRPTP